MKRPRLTKREILWRDIASQKQWIEQCGGTLAGYIANYHGINGRTIEEAMDIFKADTDMLAKLEGRVA